MCTAWAAGAVIRSPARAELHPGRIHPRRRGRLRRAQRRLVTPDLPLGPWRPGRGGEREGKALRRRASQALGVPARKQGGRACSARERSRATGRRLPTGVCSHVWALDMICVPLKTCAIVLLAFAVRAVGPSHLDSWPLLNNPQSARRAQVPRVSTSRAFGKEHAASGHPLCSPSVRGPAGDWVPAKSEEPCPFHSTQAAWPRLGGVLCSQPLRESSRSAGPHLPLAPRFCEENGSRVFPVSEI